MAAIWNYHTGGDQGESESSAREETDLKTFVPEGHTNLSIELYFFSNHIRRQFNLYFP
jgi:hypothetical protein